MNHKENRIFDMSEEGLLKVFCEWIRTNRYSRCFNASDRSRAQWVRQHRINIFFVKRQIWIIKKHRFLISAWKGFLKYFVNESALNRHSGDLNPCYRYRSRWVLQHPIHFFCVKREIWDHKETEIFDMSEEGFLKVFCEWIRTNRYSDVLMHLTEVELNEFDNIEYIFFVSGKYWIIKKHNFWYQRGRFFKVFCEWICTNRHSGDLIHVII